MRKRIIDEGLIYLVIFGLSIVMIYYNLPLGLLGVLLCAVCYWWEENRVKTSEKQLKTVIERINKDIDAINQERMYEMPIAMAIVAMDGQFLWHNQYFDREFKPEDNYNFFQKNIKTELQFDLEALMLEKEVEFSYRNRDYTVLANQFSDGSDEMLLIHFFDVTIQKKQAAIYRKNEPVFCYVLLDNYDDILETLPSHERSVVLSQIDMKLNEWAKRIDAFIIEYENDHYLMIFEKDKLKDLEEDRFSILDDIRGLETGEKTQATLSIGIGVSDAPLSIQEADEMSHASLDIALARGGDQVVVRKDESMSFYGGNTEATEKRTKVKARVKAHGLRELIREADNVLIMGHQTPDMDCLGAAVGLLGACRALQIPGRFVLKEINYSIKSLFDYLSEHEIYQSAFITPREVEAYTTRHTLLIVVDTQSVNYLEIPEIVEQFRKIVVIDHHRRSGQSIEKSMMNYTEAYASSTCELITELLQYFDVKDIIDEVEANALMAGMCMDTKMFTFKTGVRTFEAASYLRRKGADTIISKILLQDDFATYAVRSDAVKNAKILHEAIAVSSFEDDSEYAKIIAAQAADELLTIKGIKASFIILKTGGEIFISGRSMGEINVQIILETLGGGGHLAIAGAQLGDVNVEEAQKALLDAIENYMKEREEL